jgi:hypothetical protein
MSIEGGQGEGQVHDFSENGSPMTVRERLRAAADISAGSWSARNKDMFCS